MNLFGSKQAKLCVCFSGNTANQFGERWKSA
jgi:hypothetical protein